MDILSFVVISLAVWRTAHLLSQEDGPWDIVAKIRYILGVRYDVHSNPVGQSMWAKMILCVWCNSVWVGAFWGVIYLVIPPVAFALALPFALSASAIFLERFAGGK